MILWLLITGIAYCAVVISIPFATRVKTRTLREDLGVRAGGIFICLLPGALMFAKAFGW